EVSSLSLHDALPISLLLQGALQRDPELPDLPSALDFVRDNADRRIMELFFTQKTIARPVIAPPDLPAERLATLRSAFAALAADRDRKSTRLNSSHGS